MTVKITTPSDAAYEMLRRKRCQTSLHSFALNIDIPGAPIDALCPDEDLVGPARELMADHHALICDKIEQTMNTPYGRLILMLPPGAAKSSYANVALAWDMSRPKPPHRQGATRLIMTSYNDTIVAKQSRRVQNICNQPKYQVWDEPVTMTKDAAGEWTLSNDAEMLAAGITSGITGNRADGVLIDDPVKNREDADSVPMQNKVIDEYNDSIMSRLKPGAYVILIMTRWNENDLAGSILPIDYKGESGPIKCRDGMVWEVVNIPAKCERLDDPLGRKLGDYLWTEWFPPQHWAQYERGSTSKERRRWASLYQQRPSPDESDAFKRSDINWYEPGDEPVMMHLYGASDYAVTEETSADFTEHGVAGIDSDNRIWIIDWWSDQVEADKGVDAFLDIVEKYTHEKTEHTLVMWVNEGGVIDKAIRPSINRAMRERSVFVDLRTLSSIKDKRAKCASFLARCSAKSVWLPRTAWAEDLVDQLVAGAAGRFDDKYDVAGLIGRSIDKWTTATPPPKEKRSGIKPFTGAWLEYQEPRADGQQVCYR